MGRRKRQDGGDEISILERSVRALDTVAIIAFAWDRAVKNAKEQWNVKEITILSGIIDNKYCGENSDRHQYRKYFAL
jgi:hypothetical protein